MWQNQFVQLSPVPKTFSLLGRSLICPRLEINQKTFLQETMRTKTWGTLSLNSEFYFLCVTYNPNLI